MFGLAAAQMSGTPETRHLHLRTSNLNTIQPHELGGGREHGLQLPYARNELVKAPKECALRDPPRVVRRLLL